MLAEKAAAVAGRSSRSAARTWPTPRRWRSGQEIGGLARQLELSIEPGRPGASRRCCELPVGGTAVGTRHQHPSRVRPPRVRSFWPARRASPLSRRPTISRPTPSATAWSSATASCGTIAATLFNVANNIRWLGSGPRCGFYEIKLPDRQPGSSIMPGKVNPVMCESLMQVAARVMGNDQTIAFCGAAGGQFQLNVMMPVMGDALLGKHSAAGQRHAGLRRSAAWPDMEANAEACEAAVEKSLVDGRPA